MIIHCLLELANDDDFHLCSSGIGTVVVAVATWGGNYSRVVLKDFLKKGYYGHPKGTRRAFCFGKKSCVDII